MLPRKSVTALIGLSKVQSLKTHTGCEICKNIDCEFQKGWWILCVKK